ncbi:MAG: tetratricopeptide repeat protein [Chromatiales bacterium]|nr:tetratricopeptide repeat protein [Chromatiales bacterium]
MLIEVAGTLFPAFGIPDWVFRFIVVVLALGFVPTLIISWVYEITPEGFKRDKDVARDEAGSFRTARRLDVLTLVAIGVALAFIALDRLWLSPMAAGPSQLPAVTVPDSTQAAPELAEPRYPPNSIAVLPFINMSEDADNEYFSEGISEELLAELTRIPELRVTARTSSFSFKGKGATIADIARELKVSYVLEGSVRKAGNHVRVTVQLIETVSGTHLWSENYDRMLEDIFAVQDEIANRVVDELQITLLAKGETKTRQTNPDAFASFLQGTYLLDRAGSQEAFQKSEEYLRASLALDPGYAPAWEQLSRAKINQAIAGYIEFAKGYRQAKEFTEKALELDPGFAAAHASIGWIAMMYDQDLPAAATHFQKALDLSPYDARILSNSSVFAETLGRFERAIELGERTLRIDPLNSTTYANVATVYAYTGQFDKAEARFEKSAELNPEGQYMWPWFAKMYLLQGRPDQALALTDRITYEPRKLWILPMAFYDLGRVTESADALRRLKELYPNEAASYIAEIHAWRGEVDEAFYWLERAIGERQYMWGSLVFDPAFKKLRGDPRWSAIRSAVGRSEEQIKKIEF